MGSLMMEYIDRQLDGITMYRLVIYILAVTLVIAGVGGVFGLVPFSPAAVWGSAGALLAVTWATNAVFAYAYQAPTNIESVYITAMILALIIPPLTSIADLPLLIWAGVLSMASKYILAVDKKHVFNPAAMAVVLTALGFGGAASWWVGSSFLTPFVFIGGYLIARKIRREDLAWMFFGTVTAGSLVMAIASGNNPVNTLRQVWLSSPMWFFGFVMLTEPLTTPPTRGLRQIYAALTGILYLPNVHLGSLYSTPELALAAGNIFSYLVSPRHKLIMTLSEKIKTGTDTWDFVFRPRQRPAFAAGQYMEWTLPHEKADSRGIRRFLTLASSPTEDHVRIGVKFSARGSSWKKALAELDHKTPVVATQLAGDFTLPDDTGEKLVFMAGGIGITPFRSMVKYLVDKKQKRDIVLFYADKHRENLVYTDVFDAGREVAGMRVIYTLTDKDSLPADWPGETGRVDGKMIEKYVPDYRQRKFYLSGPQAMVKHNEVLLSEMGVPENRIVKDYFPGL